MMYAEVIIEEKDRELMRLRNAFDTLINDVLCLCSEGPDVMRSGDIYAELIKEANKARQAVEEGSWKK